MSELSPDSQAKCRSVLAYVEDMSAWYDEELEEKPRLEFIRDILDQIDKKGQLDRAERAWCEAEITERYG